MKDADAARRALEKQLEAGLAAPAPKTIDDTIELFLSSKASDGLNNDGLGRFERELERFSEFMKSKGCHYPSDINVDVLILCRATWAQSCPSSPTRAKIQARLRQFLHYLHDAGHLQKVPKMTTIKVDSPPRLPLEDSEHTALLATITDPRTRALVQLMRHSGLAICDAVTIPRTELSYDEATGVLRVLTARQKTGQHVYVSLPPDVSRDIWAVVTATDQQHPFGPGTALNNPSRRTGKTYYAHTFGRPSARRRSCPHTAFVTPQRSAGCQRD